MQIKHICAERNITQKYIVDDDKRITKDNYNRI